MSFMILIGFISVAIVIALFVWLIQIIYKSNPKPQDFTIITNFLPQYTNGFSEGILLDTDLGDKFNGYTFMPTDVDFYSRQKTKKFRANKNLQEVKPQTIYIRKDKFISFPRSTFSNERNKLWLLPHNPEDLPERVKSSPIGIVLMKMIDDTNNNETEVSIIREGADRVRNILNRMGDGEISNAVLDNFEKINEKVIQSMNKTDDKKPIYGTGAR